MRHRFLHTLLLIAFPALASAATAIQGYWLAERDGGVLPFGGAHYYGGDLGSSEVIAAMQSTPGGGGYWLASSKGAVHTFGDAEFFGDVQTPSFPIVGMQAAPDGKGYWLVSNKGAVYSFGDARPHGSLASRNITSPIVGMASTPDGGGCWLVDSKGGVFAFGDAHAHGSISSTLAAPIVGIASTPDGRGYWLADSTGGVYIFGDAHSHGSVTSPLASPIVGIAPTPDGGGYWLVSSDGTIFVFGNAPFRGSSSSTASPVVGIVASINAAAIPASQLLITNSGFTKGPNGGYSGKVTIKNIGSSTIDGPLSLGITLLPQGVTAAKYSGYYNDTPYFSIASPVNLTPSQEATVTVHFRDPSGTPISFTPVVYAGL